MAASLADLGDHPFGKSMVSLLNMNMKTGGPLHELRTLLQQIKDELLALTQVQDQEWGTSQRRCQVDIAQLTATLEQAQGDLESQRKEQTALLGEQTTLNARVRDDTGSLERNGRAQNDAVDRLNAENADFTSKNSDYDDAI
jgi:chromosome segregation ATPase